MKITKEKTLYIGAGLIILNNLLQYIELIIFQTTYLKSIELYTGFTIIFLTLIGLIFSPKK